MFAVEFSSSRPAGSAPYYSLVIRDAYTVGSDEGCDIVLSNADIAPIHAHLVVARESEAARAVTGDDDAAAADDGDIQSEHGSHASSKHADFDNSEKNPITEGDPLVVRLTVMSSERGATHVGDRAVCAGESVLIADGTEVRFGATSMVFRYRPLVVSIENEDFAADYVHDLTFMFRKLGATVCSRSSGPSPFLSIPPPIALLHCAAQLADTRTSLMALASGYSVVQPTYVLEWFAALAQSASSPLSVLPPPSRLEVPIVCTRRAPSTVYMRPESDNCPFSLYPISSTAMKRRLRDALFAGDAFYLASAATEARYTLPIQLCGGTVFAADDWASAKTEAAQRLGAAGGQSAGKFYIIVDGATEAAMLNAVSMPPELEEFIREVKSAAGVNMNSDATDETAAGTVPVLGDYMLFSALLRNTFCDTPLEGTAVQVTEGEGEVTSGSARPLQQRRQVEPYAEVSDDSHLHQHHHDSIVEDEALNGNVAPVIASILPVYAVPIVAQQHQQRPRHHTSDALPLGATPSSMMHASRRRTSSARQASLLPRDGARTPSRSQMRSYSKQRARSASMDPGAAMPAVIGDARSAVMVRTPRGRRCLVNPAPAPPSSFVDRFDLLRIRIYAYLMREESLLDEAIVSFQRNNYISSETMEHALEVRAQAQDFMEKVDDLLDESHGPYTDALRRFWGDCSDLDVRAQYLYEGFDRQSEAIPYRRSSASHTGASRTSSRSRSRVMSFNSGAATRSNPATSRKEKSLAFPALDMTRIEQQQQKEADSHHHQEHHKDEGQQQQQQQPLSATGGSVRDHRVAYLSMEARQRIGIANRSARAHANGAAAAAATEGTPRASRRRDFTPTSHHRSGSSPRTPQQHRSSSSHFSGSVKRTPQDTCKNHHSTEHRAAPAAAAAAEYQSNGNGALDSPNVVLVRSARRRSSIPRTNSFGMQRTPPPSPPPAHRKQQQQPRPYSVGSGSNGVIRRGPPQYVGEGVA